MIKKFFRFLFDVLGRSGKDNIMAYSAQCAFFMTISFIPLIILLISLLKFLPISDEMILSGAVSVFPGDTKELVSSLINESFHKGSAAVISITAISTLWAASFGVFSAVDGLNRVFATSETRNFIIVRIMSMFYTIVFLLLLIFCLILFVFGNTIADAIAANLSGGRGVATIIKSGKLGIGIFVLTLLFVIIYTIVPNRQTKFYTQLPGGIICSIGWVGASYLFSYYTKNVSNYSYLYGSLSAIVFFMLWLFICICILFIGAEINKCLEDRREYNFLMKNEQISL